MTYILLLGLAESPDLVGSEGRKGPCERLDLLVIREEVGAFVGGFDEELEHLRLDHGLSHL